MPRPSPGDQMPTADRPTETRATMARLLDQMAPERARLAIIVGLALVAAVTTLLGPWLIGVAIDDFIADRDVSGLAVITAVLVALYAATWLATAVYSRMMAAVAQRAIAGLRRRLFDALQHKSMRFFDRRAPGELMSRLTNDVEAIEQLLAQNLIAILRSVTTIIGLLVIMFALDWRLALAALAPVPLIGLAMWATARWGGTAFAGYQRRLGRLKALADERLNAQRLAIAYDRQGDAVEAFEALNDEARRAGTKAQTMTMIMWPLTQALGNFGVAAVAGIGGWMAITGTGGITVGLLTSFITYAQRVGQPLTQISSAVTSVLSAVAGAERVFAIVDEPVDHADDPAARPLPPVTGAVRFDHVDFSYLPGTPVLHDVSFAVEPGEMVGVVGPTGAGKSTIINILSSLYPIDRGRVTVDDLDLAAISQDSLRRQIGVVTQKPFLFTDTVRENIRFGRLDATDDEIVMAAERANADHFIRALPHGYDTVLSEGAENLSLGQRQLVTIARAILADPAVLILDEATSSVDTRTEQDIQNALLQLMAGRTSFVIAHRLSTIRTADRILVLDHGRLVEQGSHDELVVAGGLYQTLYNSQFRGATASPLATAC